MTSTTPLLEREASAAITDWLAAVLPEAVPPFAFSRIAGGYSMLTYRVSDAVDQVWVLRYPPAGKHSGGAHDTSREARAMSALRATDVPVPTVRYVGTSDSPLGLPCHITDFVDGFVLDDEAKASTLVSRQTLRAASIDIVDTLVKLHSVDPDAVGLGELGPRADYLKRQLHRWRTVAAEASIPDTAQLCLRAETTAVALERRLPESGAPGIVHGDYRLGNAITGADGRIRALLDWELVTLGDPLADLGLLAAFWAPPPEAVLGLRSPTLAPGSISLGEALERYTSQTSSTLDQLRCYHAFACWRLASTGLRAAKRFKSGSMGADTDITRFVVAATSWLDQAAELLT